MKNVDKFRTAIKKLVSEQINTDRCLVKELDDLDSAIKKLDKNYRALINNSFSRVVLDDGQNGQLFDIQLYPVGLNDGEGTYCYDMRGYFHGSDRVYQKGVKLEDIKEFIGGELKKYIEENGSYKQKSLEKGKRPYTDDKDYPHTDENLMKVSDTDKMEEVKNFKKQIDFTPEDMAERKLEELGIGIGLDELAEKIENSVWGAIKREGESTHKKTAKADHDVKDSETAKNKHILTKSKLRKAKTKKLQEKSKSAEHSENITSTPSKVGTPKVKDFNDDKRKPVNESKKKINEFLDKSTIVTEDKVEEFFNNLIERINLFSSNYLGYKELFFVPQNEHLDYQEDYDTEEVTKILFPPIETVVDVNIEPTTTNVEKIKLILDKQVGEVSDISVYSSGDSADNTKWVAVKIQFPTIDVAPKNVKNYIVVLSEWVETLLKIFKQLGVELGNKQVAKLNEGVWDRLKAGVKGTQRGASDKVKHQLDKWQASGDAIKAKARGDTKALKQHKATQKNLASKERSKTGGKRSIYKSGKEHAVARSLFDSYTKKLDSTFNNFKSDMTKSFGIEERNIVSFLNGVGLTTQAKLLEKFANDIKYIKKLSTQKTIREGMLDRATASASGLKKGISTVAGNVLKGSRSQAKAKKAEVLVSKFKSRIEKIINDMIMDFGRANFENKNLRNIPVRIQSTISKL